MEVVAWPGSYSAFYPPGREGTAAITALGCPKDEGNKGLAHYLWPVHAFPFEAPRPWNKGAIFTTGIRVRDPPVPPLLPPSWVEPENHRGGKQLPSFQDGN